MTSEEIVDSPTGWVAEHIRKYVETDGRTGHDFHGTPTLLLTTRGRRTGRLYRTALIYGRHGDDYVVVASSGGSPKHPNWYLNLVDRPDVGVQVRGDRFDGRARTATARERAALWEPMVAIFPLYAEYEQKTSREIPVVIIERVAEG